MKIIIFHNIYIMVSYARKRLNYRSTRRSTRSARRIIRGKPGTAKNQAGIRTLARKVARIQKTVNARTLTGTFAKSGDFDVSSALVSYANQQLITPLSGSGTAAWSQVFDLDTSVQFMSTLNIKSMNMQYKFYPGDEESPIDCTLCLITPKTRKVLEDTFNESTGALNLTSNVDYYINNGMVLINLRRWKLHHYKRTVTVLQDGTQGLEYPVATNPGSCKLKLNWKIHNTNGNWSQVSQNDFVYYMRLFIVTFNNNSFSDLEAPSFKHSTIFNCTAHQ